MHDAILARIARLRGETTPYLSRPEARALAPTLDAGVAAGDPWALWVRGRVADDHLLDEDPTDAGARARVDARDRVLRPHADVGG